MVIVINLKQIMMKKVYVYIIATVILLILIYFFGITKTISENMEWKSFKINTKIFLALVLIYSGFIFFIYKKY